MYLTYFGLNENPFSIAPDPRYLYMSVHHREALAHLLYGVRSDGGFVLLTGEIGAGKTTLCRRLLGDLPEGVDVAFVLNPKVTVIELLESICDELRITRPQQPTVKNLVDSLNSFLLETNARGRKTVLIIDEAQILSLDVLEQLRLLTNLETDRRKLLQIVLLGQPELRHMLARPELQQLAQRVTARYHLGPLGEDEIADYVRHRLGVAGCNRQIFPPKAIRKLWQETRGVPRLLNLVCDRALLGAYARDQQLVDVGIVHQAAREVIDDLGRPADRSRYAAVVTCTLLLLCGLGAGLWAWGNHGPGFASIPAPPAVQTVTAVPVPTEVVASSTDEEPELLGESDMAAQDAAPAPALATSWPADFAFNQGRETAFADLARLWEFDYAPGKSAFCSTAAASGLKCMTRQDSLERLRGLNRPAVLTLYADDGSPYYIVMAELSERKARFLAGEEVRELDVAALEARWFGEFLLLWKVPERFDATLQPGTRGDAVKWLAEMLEEIGRYRVTGQETHLDGQLLGALKSFQFAAGLAPDGIVGPLTAIHLNSARGVPGPRLHAGPSGGAG